MFSSSSKRAGEAFFLFYSIVWIGLLAAIVQFRLWKSFAPKDYVALGLSLSLPSFLIPMLFPLHAVDRNKSISNRYVIKANVFIGIIGCLGNHFYTHYFYAVLHVRYTGPLHNDKGWSFNGVPISMHLLTHPYFCFYHVLATKLLRCFRAHVSRNKFARLLFLCGLSYSIAWMETYTISSFPYYTYPNLSDMLTYGSLFYALFLAISVPLFARIDEEEEWEMKRVVIEALATMMLILIVADMCRLALASKNQHLPFL